MFNYREKFIKILTEPLLECLEKATFGTSDRRHPDVKMIYREELYFTNPVLDLEERRKLHEVYSLFFSELAKKMEALAMDTYPDIEITESFVTDFTKALSDAVDRMFSGHPFYTPHLNEKDPTIDNPEDYTGEKFVTLNIIFLITMSDKFPPAFMWVANTENWEKDKVNPELVNKLGLIEDLDNH
jgi:hypothetical protein